MPRKKRLLKHRMGKLNVDTLENEEASPSGDALYRKQLKNVRKTMRSFSGK